MRSLYDEVSLECSRITTKKYSTSFSLGILSLHKSIRYPIYAIYGFVRFADEIVDTLHEFDKQKLLHDFRKDTYEAITQRVSLNPIIHSFQAVVNKYNIRHEWIDCFLQSMEMDLQKNVYTDDSYKKYILGSAEVVGLMCLHVFTDGNDEKFDALRPYAMRLGAALQKVNFLRDVKADSEALGRTYFPDIDLNNFSEADKKKIEADIDSDFEEALKGIKMLPKSSRNGVYLAYHYYTVLFKKIKRLPPQHILHERVRIPDLQKLLLMVNANLKIHLKLI